MWFGLVLVGMTRIIVVVDIHVQLFDHQYRRPHVVHTVVWQRCPYSVLPYSFYDGVLPHRIVSRVFRLVHHQIRGESIS